MKNVLVIMGATGTGKTELAKRIYSEWPAKIISIDAVMVYKGMDIGTAKPSAEELKIFPHSLVDICSPVDSFSVADCVSEVSKLVSEAHLSGDLPILVGGTMMYHYVLQHGIHNMPNTDFKIRQQVMTEYEKFGLEFQWQKLFEKDPAYASKLAKNDQQRIHRGLEVLEEGVKPSEMHSQPRPKGVLDGYNIINLVLACDRALLYEKLMLRFDLMMQLGFVDEVEGLLSLYPNIVEKPAFRAIGYRQIAGYVLGNMPYAVAVEEARTATRRFAKRQHTWLKRWRDSANWLDALKPHDLSIIKCLLE